MRYIQKSLHGEQYAKLFKALSDIGVFDDTLEIAKEYLDLEQDRNDALLKQIQKQDFSSLRGWDKRNNLAKAVQKEINRVNRSELFERYAALSYAIAGVHCTKLALFEMTGSHSDIKNVLRKALEPRFMDEANSIVQAVWYTGHNEPWSYTSSYVNYHYHAYENDDPQLCIKATDYVSDYQTKLFLVLTALHNYIQKEYQKSIKELVFGKRQKLLQKDMLSILDELINESKQYPDLELYLLMAIAEAVYLDKKYMTYFSALLLNHPLKIEKLAETALQVFDGSADHVCFALDELPVTFIEYIRIIAHTVESKKESSLYSEKILKSRDVHLKKLAEKFPNEYRTLIAREDNPVIAEHLEKIYKSVYKNYQPEISLKGRARLHCVNSLTEDNPDFKYKIQKYLLGEMDTAEFLTILPSLKTSHRWDSPSIGYMEAYGLDTFAERCICFIAMLYLESYISTRSLRYVLEHCNTGFVEILRKHQVPVWQILCICAKFTTGMYVQEKQKIVKHKIMKSCAVFIDDIVQTDVKSLPVEARCLYVEILGENGKYKYMPELFAMTDDTSKAVRSELVTYLPRPADAVDEKILALLNGKKIAQREIAIALLEEKFPESWKSAVEQAFAVEKNEKLKIRLGKLLGEEFAENIQQAANESLIDSLTKGNKSRKTAWLFENAFTPVHNLEQQEVSETYLQAMLNCYADMSAGNYSRSEQADKLACDLNQAELERFAQEVFSRWLSKGAEAKTKWVIYFTGIYGGIDAVQTLQHYIKDWSEHSRGAIASEAVYALAFNGSPSALMAVDAMARKFKNKQVRSAANTALQKSAEILGITREELADKIVPDLDFDENLCRIFDYGTRQFHVYLTPALEIEIYEGEKKLKNLPKAGVKDDAEKSAQAMKTFKDMKKQMKTVVQSQKFRLEYSLLCNRKWSVQGWKDLFIQKPVMHCFAIGLIWGAYENQKLVQTFRYLEDGSFNTSDEEEYEIPEHVQIGLVHPIEMQEDEIATWSEQLTDYEITQPFSQLTRKVYRLLPEELKKDTLQRFSGKEMNNLTLMNKMLKLDWSKGYAQDAGYFYEFCRDDIAGQEKDKDGNIQYTGYHVELKFNGMYIGSSYADTEDVMIEDVRFWSLEKPVKEDNFLKLEQVSEKYLSEIILQLTSIFGEAGTEDEA